MTSRSRAAVRALACLVVLPATLRLAAAGSATATAPETRRVEVREKVLHAYSPYHHVQRGAKYPAVLFVTGDADTRVDPLHARKMAALLQASSGSDRPVLLHYDTKAGHSGGGTPTSKMIKDQTDELSFLFWQLGVRYPLD